MYYIYVTVKSILTKLTSNYTHLLVSLYNCILSSSVKVFKKQDNAFTVTRINTTRLFHNLIYCMRVFKHKILYKHDLQLVCFEYHHPT